MPRNKLIIIGSGTGFVVHPEYILTNRHVVEGCEGLLVVPPGEENHELPASVVGVADGEDDDLAVIHCKGLAAPPLPFIRADLAPRGTEIMVLGYPSMIPGETPSLKSTRGTIAGLPDASYNAYTLDAITNPGSSGGPICDATGSVLGIHCGRVSPVTSQSHLSYGYAVPHSRVLPLLKKLIPGYEQLPPNANKKQWSDVDGMVSRSTVLIWVQRVESVGGISGKQEAPKGARPFEDRWCMTCYRIGYTKCPTCKGTGKAVAAPLTIVKSIGPTGTEYRNRYPEKVTCWSCRGTAKVQCPDCVEGIEVELHGIRASPPRRRHPIANPLSKADSQFALLSERWSDEVDFRIGGCDSPELGSSGSKGGNHLR